MKRTSKPSEKRRWGEDIHVTVGVGCTVLVIAALVGFFGYVYKPAPRVVASSSEQFVPAPPPVRVKSDFRGPR